MRLPRPSCLPVFCAMSPQRYSIAVVRQTSEGGGASMPCTHCATKIVFENDHVWMLKHCPTHGSERVLISDDVAYYRQCREVYLKPPEMPLRRNTPIKYGCPYDCGLCPDHEQHSCLALIEINETCNLTCPVCFADSAPARSGSRSLEEVEAMLETLSIHWRALPFSPFRTSIAGSRPRCLSSAR